MFDEMRKMLESIILLQVIFLFVFILFNFDSLDSVSIQIEVANQIYTITINLYATSIACVIVFVLIASASGIQVAASGLNEISTKAILKFVALFTVFAHFLLAEGWLFQYIGDFGTILLIFFRLADILYFVIQLEK